jgi:hypothetical protein
MNITILQSIYPTGHNVEYTMDESNIINKLTIYKERKQIITDIINNKNIALLNLKCDKASINNDYSKRADEFIRLLCQEVLKGNHITLNDKTL